MKGPNQLKLPCLCNHSEGDLGVRKTLHFLMHLQAQLKKVTLKQGTNSCPRLYQSCDCGDKMLYLDILKLKFGNENSAEISDNFQLQLP